ncbi:MAG TPA: hypothetical protein VFO93_03780 [Hymenobacter sp.]|uniref:alginate O-acetyltransferase AlgX-related protein n=1 Tax=Hymenobacter sp. TaxID=1898978 RepID=UPI002D7E2DCA|nr:hypothetical protein [Hymenobacter sp.]HET9502633.1 hypothetical protein [Hymenobacter sp.]
MPYSSKLATYGQRLVLGSLLLLLLLPALQAQWPLLPVRPLDGATLDAPRPIFSWGGLLAGRYQADQEKYLTEQLGFRPWLVRVRNQLAFMLYHKPLADGIILGKDQNLFQYNSIIAYLGEGHPGEEPFEQRARQLRQVQDSLHAHGTELLFVLAPGKPRIVPHYLPDQYNRWQTASDYHSTRQAFAKYGVNTLDAAALLLRWQAASPPYPLFTRTGTHWSGYATTRVADTLFHRIEQLTGQDLPDFGPQGPPTVATRAADLRHSDKDLEDLLNLMQGITPYPTAYPHIVFKLAQGKQRPNALIIGDSFTQSFYTFYPYFDRLLAPESRFWYYKNTVYWPAQTPPGESRNVKDLDLAAQLRGRKLVLLLAMEANLHPPDLGFGFVDEALKVYGIPAQ